MKIEKNDSLRQFVNRFAPAAQDLGLTINIVTKDEGQRHFDDSRRGDHA